MFVSWVLVVEHGAELLNVLAKGVVWLSVSSMSWSPAPGLSREWDISQRSGRGGPDV